MPLDPSIALGVKPIQIQSPVNQLAAVLGVQNAQQQNQLGSLSLQEKQRSLDESNRLRDVLSQQGFDVNNPDHQRQLVSAAPVAGPAFLKANADYANLRSTTDKNTAEATKFRSEAGKTDQAAMFAKADRAMADITSFKNPVDAAANIDFHVKNGDLKPEVAEQLKSSMPQDPSQFAAWQVQKIQGILSAKERMGYIAPDANTVANNQTSIANNSATNATSRANNAANIGKDLRVAGMDANGGLDDNMERTAKAVASGQLPPPTGIALLNPKNQRMLGRVMEINPDYDFTNVTAKKAAATAFTSGNLGNALRSVSTANAHLDQMNELVDALGNGNTQAINKISNWYQTQTGNAAPTNFGAIKNVVGQEVVKAIVAGGGGVGEREEAAKAFSTANSPAQLKEAIQHYRMIMGAQADNLLAQRDAAGLSRSTLPNYNNASKASAVPPDIQTLLQKHGGQ